MNPIHSSAPASRLSADRRPLIQRVSIKMALGLAFISPPKYRSLEDRQRKVAEMADMFLADGRHQGLREHLPPDFDPRACIYEITMDFAFFVRGLVDWYLRQPRTYEVDFKILDIDQSSIIEMLEGGCTNILSRNVVSVDFRFLDVLQRCNYAVYELETQDNATPDSSAHLIAEACAIHIQQAITRYDDRKDHNVLYGSPAPITTLLLVSGGPAANHCRTLVQRGLKKGMLLRLHTWQRFPPDWLEEFLGSWPEQITVTYFDDDNPWRFLVFR